MVTDKPRQLRPRLSPALITAAVGLGIGGAALSLIGVIDNPWLPILGWFLAVITVLLVITRWVGLPHRADLKLSRALFPTFIALICGSAILIRLFVPHTPTAPVSNAAEVNGGLFYSTISGVLNFLSVLGSSVHGAFTQANQELYLGVAPLAPTSPLLFVTFTLILLLLLSAEFLAHTKIPLLALLPIVALWAPAIGLGWQIPTSSLFATLGSIVLLLWLLSPRPRRPRDSRKWRTRNWRSALAGTSVAALALSVGWVATGATASQFTSRRIVPDYSMSAVTEFGEIVDGSHSLGNRSPEVLFTYSTSSGQSVGHLRFATYTMFTGAIWYAQPETLGADKYQHIVADGGKLIYWEPEDTTSDAQVDVTIEIAALHSNTIPSTGDPRRITTDHITVNRPLGHQGWQLNYANDSARAADVMAPGSVVEMSVFRRPLSPVLLRAASGGPTIPAQPQWVANYMYDRGFRSGGNTLIQISEPALSHHLEVDSASINFLAETANAITQNTDTYFDAAVAIQNYLRNTTVFTYSTEPPPANTGHLVRDFLEARSGYCVHFATTMVMLSRAAGIPARLAVGYLPGIQLDANTWAVTDQHAHSWAELYFGPSVGWVTFDPTPTSISGPPPAHTIIGQGSYPLLSDYEAEWLTNVDWQAAAGAYGAREQQRETDDADTSPWADFTWLTSSWLSNSWLASNWLSNPVVSYSFIALVAITVVGVTASGINVLRKKKRKTLTDHETVWEIATTSLIKRGIPIQQSVTPRQLPQIVATGWQEKYHSQPPENLVSALQTIATAVENKRYQSADNVILPADLRIALNQVKKAERVKRPH